MSSVRVPPLKGEGGERSEPGGVCSPSHRNLTPPAAFGGTLPAKREGLRKSQPCAGKGLPPAVTGLAATSVKAMTQGTVPLFTQLWMVPRCTSTSPALRCTLPISVSYTHLRAHETDS